MTETQINTGPVPPETNTNPSPQNFRNTRLWYHISDYDVELVAKCIEACVAGAHKEYKGPSEFLKDDPNIGSDAITDAISIITGTGIGDESIVKNVDMYNTVPSDLTSLTGKVRSIQHCLNQWVQKFGEWKKTFTLTSMEIQQDLLAFDRMLRSQGTKPGWLRPGVYLWCEGDDEAGPDDFRPPLDSIRHGGRWFGYRFEIVLPPIVLSTEENPDEQDNEYTMPAMALEFQSDWIREDCSWVPKVKRLFMPGENVPLNSEYFHPNVSGNGVMCLGDGMTNFVSMIQSGQFTGAMEVAYSVISTYGYQNPYATLTNIFEHDDDLEEHYCAVNGNHLGEWSEGNAPDDVRWLSYHDAEGYSHEEDVVHIEGLDELRHDEHARWDDFGEEYYPHRMYGFEARELILHARPWYQPEGVPNAIEQLPNDDMIWRFKKWLQDQEHGHDLALGLEGQSALREMSTTEKDEVSFNTVSIARSIPDSDFFEGRDRCTIHWQMERTNWRQVLGLPSVPGQTEDFLTSPREVIEQPSDLLYSKLRTAILCYFDQVDIKEGYENSYREITMTQAVFGHFLFATIQKRLQQNTERNEATNG